MAKRINLTTSMDIPITDIKGFYASVGAGYYTDWSIKLNWFMESYNSETNEAIGSLTEPILTLFIFAICQQCGKFLDEEDLIFIDTGEDEEHLICGSCVTKEVNRDMEFWADYDAGKHDIKVNKLDI